MHQSPDLEHLPAAGGGARAPLLFVHGAFATPWVWRKHFMPWFAERDHHVYALRLGRSVSTLLPALEPGLCDYRRELEATIDGMPRPPVVVAHSLGALVAQMALGRTTMAGLALLAPVPPTGMIWSTLRLALDDPALVAQTSLATVDVRYATLGATRESLFAEDVPDAVVAETLANMRSQPTRPLLEAQWPCHVASARRVGVQALTVAGGRDRLIGVATVRRTAGHHGARHVTVRDAGHALMLDPSWRETARALARWIHPRDPALAA
jgi:pimeloyl-ACP methyl ester carboxylesterase